MISASFCLARRRQRFRFGGMDTKQRTKWSFTGIGVFGAAVALLIGIPGFADDLESWKRAIDQARLSNTDWTIWFLIALGFALVAVGPWVIPSIYLRLRVGRIEGRTGTLTEAKELAKSDGSDNLPPLQNVSRQLQEAIDESASLSAQLDEVRTERDRERSDKETLAKETTELRLAVQNRQASLQEVYWKVRFGHSRPIVPDLSLAETEAVRLRTQELRPALGKAAGQFEALFLDLLNKMRSGEKETGLPWLADFVSEHSLGRMGFAWHALIEVLDYSEDIRRHIIGFCWNYSEAKMWLIRVLELLRWPSEVAADYERWRETDKALGGELERLLARNSMRSVHDQIKHGPPAVDLPAWPV